MGETAFIALGSNLGNRAAYLASALNALTLVGGLQLVAVSDIEETAPLAGLTQPPYLNQMVALRSSIEPMELLHRTQQIEATLGRVRGRRWGARTIDLDIVRFGARKLTSSLLTLPHPGIADRAFWQREIAQLEARVTA